MMLIHSRKISVRITIWNITKWLVGGTQTNNLKTLRYVFYIVHKASLVFSKKTKERNFFLLLWYTNQNLQY